VPRLLLPPLKLTLPAVFIIENSATRRLVLMVRTVFFVLVTTVLLSSTMLAYADEIAEQSKKLQQLRARIEAVRHEINSMQDQHDTLQGALQKTEKQIGDVTAELRQLDASTTTVQQKTRDLQDQRSVEDMRLAAMRTRLAQEFQVAYMTGRQERIRLLLSQEDPAAVGRMLVYHGYFARARGERMQQLLASLQKLRDIELALVEQQAEIGRLRQQQSDKSASLLEQQDSRRKILAQLQAQMQVRATELGTLEQDQERLQKLVQSLTLALQEMPHDDGQYTSLRQLKGKLRWPVAGRITQSFGAKETQDTLRTRGVHIATQTGVDVQAIARGRIAFSDWLRGFGLLLIIDHGEGYMSLYGQNRSLYREVGEWVERGEAIAAAGDSGGKATAGLYLELRKNGKPFNPAPWFSGKPQPLQLAR
jgi:septal ring factor EnvC (AmiA/AmiB activator)